MQYSSRKQNGCSTKVGAVLNEFISFTVLLQNIPHFCFRMQYTNCLSILLVLALIITTFQSATAQNITRNNNNNSTQIITQKTFSCPENEEWAECGTHCPPHCPAYNPQSGQVDDDGSSAPCILSCRQGCQCRPGLFRDHRQNGRCVPLSRCTPITLNLNRIRTSCGPNEVFEECGTACPDLCPYFDPETGELVVSDSSKPKMCTKQCVVGCACRCGFLRDPKQSGSPCVHREQCLDP